MNCPLCGLDTDDQVITEIVVHQECWNAVPDDAVLVACVGVTARRLSVDELAQIRSGVALFWTQASRARKYSTEDQAWVEAIIAEQWAIVASQLLDHLDAVEVDAAERIGRA